MDKSVDGITFRVFLWFTFSDALPLQHLPPKPGFVPVFIRYGDEPLESINPALAVAFREAGFEGRNIKEDDTDGHMLADDPVPVPAAPVSDVVDEGKKDLEEVKEEVKVEENSDPKPEVDDSKPVEEVKPEPAAASDESIKNEPSDSNESGSQEEPKALPVQPENEKVNEAVEN